MNVWTNQGELMYKGCSDGKMPSTAEQCVAEDKFVDSKGTEIEFKCVTGSFGTQCFCTGFKCNRFNNTLPDTCRAQAGPEPEQETGANGKPEPDNEADEKRKPESEMEADGKPEPEPARTTTTTSTTTATTTTASGADKKVGAVFTIVASVIFSIFF